MDVLAHGLWGGIFFGRRSRRAWGWALLWGIFPDVFAFGPAMAMQAFHGELDRWSQRPPPLDSFPSYVFASYDISHSLVVWSAAAIAAAYWRGKFPWPIAAWALHILCDIPFHSIRYFPTPYLWPLPTPFVDGVAWARPDLLAINWALMLGAYTVWTIRRRRAPH